MQFLYSMGDTYYFMNMQDYEQIELDKSTIGDDAKFLKENLEVEIIFFEGEMLGMNLPDFRVSIGYAKYDDSLNYIPKFIEKADHYMYLNKNVKK